MASMQKSHGGVLDVARGAAERAREFVLEKKEGVQQTLAGDADAVERKGETNESAWQQGEDVRRRAAEKAQEERGAVREPTEAEKGRAATENIYGKAMGGMGAFGEKMVMPTDVVERKRAEAAAGDGNAPKGSGRDEQGSA